MTRSAVLATTTGTERGTASADQSGLDLKRRSTEIETGSGIGRGRRRRRRTGIGTTGSIERGIRIERGRRTETEKERRIKIERGIEIGRRIEIRRRKEKRRRREKGAKAGTGMKIGRKKGRGIERRAERGIIETGAVLTFLYLLFTVVELVLQLFVEKLIMKLVPISWIFKVNG